MSQGIPKIVPLGGNWGRTDEPGELTALLQEKFPESLMAHHNQHNDETVIIQPEGMREVFSFLKSDKTTQMDMLLDITAVDYLPRSPRFEVVYHLKSLDKGHRLRVKIPLEENTPEVDSIHDLWAAVNWYERECHEMLGIVFKGHPNLGPLLLYKEFVGFPLRKDYEKGKMQPLVPLMAVQERYDYGEEFCYPPEESKEDKAS